MKKLGLDLRGLQAGHEFRGIGVYMRAVVEEMFSQGIDKKYQVIIYHYDSSDPLKLLLLPEDAQFRRVVFKNPKQPDPKKGKRAKAYGYIKEMYLNHYRWSPVPRVWSLDIFVQFDQHLGLPRSPFIKKVLVVHDLIPLVYRHQYLPGVLTTWRKLNWKAALKTAASNYRYRLGLKQIRRANKVLAISENTKNDLIARLGIRQKKITVVHNGGVHRSASNPPDLKKQTHFTPSDDVDAIIEKSAKKPFLLFIGGPEPPRRRLDHLVTAYHHLRAAGREVQLVLVGKELASVKSIPSATTALMLEHLSYQTDLHLLGYVSDQDVLRLYKHALCFVFPSLYEGFGIPLLEAMDNDCAVITYDNSSVPEVAGDAAIKIKPGPDEIAKAVTTLLDSPSSRQELIQKGRRQAKKFSWEKTARKTIEVINGS